MGQCGRRSDSFTGGFRESFSELVRKDLTLRDEESLNQEGRGKPLPKGKFSMGKDRETRRVWSGWESRGGGVVWKVLER